MKNKTLEVHVMEIINNAWSPDDYEYKRFRQLIVKRFGKNHWDSVVKKVSKIDECEKRFN